MVSKEERDRVIQEVISMLYNARAQNWSIQDKGVLVAAIKLQLEEKPIGPIKAMLDMTVGNQ